jgi:hypothetical protein
MQTFQEQKAFFDQHWPAMKQAVELDGSQGAIDFILSFNDDMQRSVLFVFAHFGLVNEDWQGKSFDAYIEVCDAGIAELLRQADTAGDDETRNSRTNAANVISYNLAADLAPCWPEDVVPRAKHHFERGLKAAQDCVHWREMLHKPPMPFSMAYWTQGIHQLALGDGAAAAESMAKSLDYAKQASQADGGATEVSSAADFSILLGAGYFGLARWAAGDAKGKAQYEEAIALFKAQLDDAEKKDDAEFGIAQLEIVKAKFVGDVGAIAGDS